MRAMRNETSGFAIRRWMVLATAALMASTAEPAGADMSITPGKEAIYASGSNVAIPGGFYSGTPTLSGQILKGKRKRVLEMSVTWTNLGVFGPTQSAARFIVNGVSTEPIDPVSMGGWSHGLRCDNGLCTTTARSFLDLDVAEGQNPGSFINQPLNVELHIFQDGTPGTLVHVVMEARVQKK